MLEWAIARAARASFGRALYPPMASRVQEIIGLLAPLYGPVTAPREYDALSELVYTILSQHTSDGNSTRAYAGLRAAFPSWDAVVAAPTETVAEAIRSGGLARVKAARVQAVLREVRRRCGGYGISFLAGKPMADAKAWLRELPGVGPKTAGCVLLFALNKPAMVVDTHIHRVARRLGLVGPKVNAEQAHDLLEGMVPPEQVLPFHMYLIRHGRRVCKAQRPLCGGCVLESRCPSSLLRAPAEGKGRRRRRREAPRERKS